MPNNVIDTLPEVFVSTKEISAAVSRGVRQGRLKKIGSRLYTQNVSDAPEDIVRRNVWPLVASYVPGALIADRTAIENMPAEDGSVFVVSTHKRDIELPGITIRSRRGHHPLESDRPFIGDLFLSSMPRAYLDNMARSRARGGSAPRALSSEEMESRLETVLSRGGEIALDTLRDNARRIAGEIGRQEEFAALDRLIGALLGTRKDRLTSRQAKARRAGAPFDPDRIRLFERLHASQRDWPAMPRPAPERDRQAQATLAFFEAYFSNFIEGTEFEVSEAADIVFRGRIPAERPEDAHDVLGTWRIVGDLNEMRRTPNDAESFEALLRGRHATIMAGRPTTNPGTYKQEANRAGSTVFVAPDLVRGTLQRGFEFCKSLDSAFSRAVFMMFLVSEVHPFADGNGRIARAMMNAELVAAGQERILIPTVYRNNYLAALRALSQSNNPAPITRVLDHAQTWTRAIAWGDLEQSQSILDGCHAFTDPGQADDLGIRLTMPEAAT